MSNTGSAYSEHLLESFQRRIFVPSTILQSEEFNSTFNVNTLAQKLHQTQNFVKDIEDDIFKNVHKTLKIRCQMKRYLPYFSANDTRLREDVPQAYDLECMLKGNGT